MIAWDDSLTTGLPEIDAQHKELLDRLNAFPEALTQGKGREETGKMLDFLQFYAQWHSQREEKCMEQYECPVAGINKQAHAEFVKRFGQLYEQYRQSDIDPQIVHNTSSELQKWLFNHIKRVDTGLHPCVKASQSRESSR